MEQILIQVRQALRGMWHYRWWGLAAAWVVAAGAFVLMYSTPPKYEASARVYVDTQSILKPLLSGLAVQPNTDQQVALLSRTLLSRPTLEKLVRQNDLDAGLSTKAQVDELMDGLAASIQIRNVGSDNLYTLSFRHRDPDRARKVVQSLVSIFVESGLGQSRTDSQQAKKFIDEQIKQYEEKLVAAEDRVKTFRLKNIEVMNPDGKDANTRFGQAVEQYERARLELREARNARNEARRQLEDYRARQSGGSSAVQGLLQESMLNVSTPELDARIDAQRKALDGLLLRYTEAHPDVVNGRMLLKSLEDQKRREVVELRRAAQQQMGRPSYGATATNPADAELQRMVAAAEVQVASLQARADEFGAKVAQARQMMKASPRIEAEAARLNRDYALNKKSYEDLLMRRQSAELSGDLDEAAGLAEFRVIDPPRVSPKPISPNRLVMIGGSLAAALAVGMGLVFVLSEIRPVFTSGRQLMAKAKLPLLGVVGVVQSPERMARTRKANLGFYGLSGALVMVHLTGVALVVVFSGMRG